MSAISSSQTTSYQEYVEGTLIPGIRKMQSIQGLEFLSFGIIGISIEALGSFFDLKPLEQGGLSKPRFKKAVDELFKPLRKEYENEADCLFRGLRCGMAHIGRPQGKIAFTTRSEAQADGNKHLNKDHQGMLVLVAEDLANDFVAAWSALKTQCAEGKTKKRVTDPWLTLYHYES